MSKVVKITSLRALFPILFALFVNVVKQMSFLSIANEPAERRRSAGEAAENNAARRMLYAKKFSIRGRKCKCKCKM